MRLLATASVYRPVRQGAGRLFLPKSLFHEYPSQKRWRLWRQRLLLNRLDGLALASPFF
jgi:hypothetical protein